MALTESRTAKYFLATLATYVSVSMSIERAVQKTKAWGYLDIEQAAVLAGESFSMLLTVRSWVLSLADVSEARIVGSEGILIVGLRTRRGPGTARITLIAIARTGTHEVNEIDLFLKLKPFAMTVRATLKAGLVLRAVPLLREMLTPVTAGAPYDIGLSGVRRPGAGTQFYANKEYRMGDDLRYVDWKASSRTGKLVVKVFEREVYRNVVFVLSITSRYLKRTSNAFDLLIGELAKLVGELVKHGTEVVVVVVSHSSLSAPVFVKIRSADDMSRLAECFSRVKWAGALQDYYLEFRSALWVSVKVLTELVSGKSVVVYVGEPESDVDVAASRIVASIVKNMGHKPVFAVVSPGIIRMVCGETSTEDLIDLVRISRVPVSEISPLAKVLVFRGEDLLGFLMRTILV